MYTSKLNQFWIGCLFISACFISCKSNLKPKSAVQTADTVESFTANSCGMNQSLVEITNENWVKIWDEEFDLNLNNWKKWIGGAFNNEYQYYNGEKNITIKEGVLIISPKLEPITGVENPYSNTQRQFNYTSARIETGNKFSPNGPNYNSLRISARIKTPSGTGMWPAFWAYGDAWPTNGEIDILEQNGAKPTEYSSTYHFGKEVNKDEWVATDLGIYQSNTDLTKCWHIYECIWQKDKITYLIDGKDYYSNTSKNVTEMYDKLQNIVINLAIGGNYVNNPAPSSIVLNPMYVDWVRVFAK